MFLNHPAGLVRGHFLVLNNDPRLDSIVSGWAVAIPSLRGGKVSPCRIRNSYYIYSPLDASYELFNKYLI